MLDPYFCGCLFVDLHKRGQIGWMLRKHCDVRLLLKGQQPEDVWPMMSGLTVCVKKDLLYFHLEKNKNNLLDVSRLRGLHLRRLIYCKFSLISFLSFFT